MSSCHSFYAVQVSNEDIPKCIDFQNRFLDLDAFYKLKFLYIATEQLISLREDDWE